MITSQKEKKCSYHKGVFCRLEVQPEFPLTGQGIRHLLPRRLRPRLRENEVRSRGTGDSGEQTGYAGGFGRGNPFLAENSLHSAANPISRNISIMVYQESELKRHQALVGTPI